MSVALFLDPVSVTQTTDYLEESREKILQAVREGMQEAMRGLASTAIAELAIAGVQVRTGQLVENIAESPKVTETSELIRGTVSAETDITLGGKKSKHIGLWMEEGTHVPEVTGTLFEFTEPDGGSFWAHGHRAFDVKPHPFMNPALHDFEATILEIITKHVEEALP